MEAMLKEVEFEQKALSWPEKAKAVTIRDQATYCTATDLLIAITDLEREIIAHHKPIKDTAYAAHKAAVAAEKRLLDPLTEAKTIIKRSVGAWDQEQERIRLEAQRKAWEAARKAEEEARLALAVQAESAGATEETVQEIILTPIPIPAPIVAPTYQRTSGIGTTQRWHAEITDIKALCRAVAEGKASAELVMGNMPALNKLAVALKGTMSIPGCRAVSEASISVRR